MDDYITPLDENLDFDDIGFIQEAPGDENDAGNADTNVETNDNDNAQDNTADDNANNDQNDNNNDQNNDNKNDQENDDNFDVDVNDGDDNNDKPGNDNGGEDIGGEGEEVNDENTEETDEEKDLNARIDKIYDQLTPAEKEQRDVVLRRHYKDLYQALDVLINNTQEFPMTSDSSKLIRRLIRNLRDFKEYLLHYFTNTYSIKSHLENLTRYRQFVQIYSGIESIYKDLEQAFSNDFDRFGRNVDELNKQNTIDN